MMQEGNIYRKSVTEPTGSGSFDSDFDKQTDALLARVLAMGQKKRATDLKDLELARQKEIRSEKIKNATIKPNRPIDLGNLSEVTAESNRLSTLNTLKSEKESDEKRKNTPPPIPKDSR